MTKKCPKCGGESGFLVVKTVRHTEFIDWNGLVLDVSGVTLYENKKIKCCDCGLLIDATAEIKNAIKNKKS